MLNGAYTDTKHESENLGEEHYREAKNPNNDAQNRNEYGARHLERACCQVERNLF